MVENEYNKDENDIEDFQEFVDFYGLDDEIDDGDPEELKFNED